MVEGDGCLGERETRTVVDGQGISVRVWLDSAGRPWVKKIAGMFWAGNWLREEKRLHTGQRSQLLDSGQGLRIPFG
jgi:hypothetical protein